MSMRQADSWIVVQIGAREHYAIPRALHARGELAALVTDFWVPPGSVASKLPAARRLRDRWHPDLADANVFAPNLRMLAFETRERLKKSAPWDRIIRRNTYFPKQALARLAGPQLSTLDPRPSTLFSYSYAALELFKFAKARGWRTVLGQIDPGPEEERIVAEEHRRYAHLKTGWQPAPQSYWDSWREETRLADRIIVNSEWSRECLAKQGVPDEKMEVVPLAFEEGSRVEGREPSVEGKEMENGKWKMENDKSRQESRIADSAFSASEPLRVLFLGQINLRKGIGRLLDAMRILKDEPIALTLVGPAEIDPSAWADLPNVKWLGPAARSAVASYYKQADLFILPTLSDGYAITMLEALSSGLPLLVSRYCGDIVSVCPQVKILQELEPNRIADAMKKIHYTSEKNVEISYRAPSLSDIGEKLMSLR